MGHKLIGQILLEMGAGGVTVDAIDQALVLQAQNGKDSKDSKDGKDGSFGRDGGRLGEVLVKMRVATEEDVLQALGRQLGIAYLAELKPDDVDAELAPKVPLGFAKQHRILPLRAEAGTVLVATADSGDAEALRKLGLPERDAVAIEFALSADAHAVHLLRVDERHAPRLEVPLDAGLALRIVLDLVRAEEHRARQQSEHEWEPTHGVVRVDHRVRREWRRRC